MTETDNSTLAADCGDEEDKDFEALGRETFEAVQIDLKSLPTGEELNSSVMVGVRMAAVILGKSKEELIEIVRDMPDELGLKTLDMMEDAGKHLQELSNLARSGVARFLVAGAAGVQ